MTDEARHELYKALEEVIGLHATTLMGGLPPSGWADVATERDLERLEAKVDAKIERRIGDVERQIHDLQRNLFFGIVTMQTAFLGIVIAVVR